MLDSEYLGSRHPEVRRHEWSLVGPLVTPMYTSSLRPRSLWIDEASSLGCLFIDNERLTIHSEASVARVAGDSSAISVPCEFQRERPKPTPYQTQWFACDEEVEGAEVGPSTGVDDSYFTFLKANIDPSNLAIGLSPDQLEDKARCMLERADRLEAVWFLEEAESSLARFFLEETPKTSQIHLSLLPVPCDARPELHFMRHMLHLSGLTTELYNHKSCVLPVDLQGIASPTLNLDHRDGQGESAALALALQGLTPVFSEGIWELLGSTMNPLPLGALSSVLPYGLPLSESKPSERESIVRRILAHPTQFLPGEYYNEHAYQFAATRGVPVSESPLLFETLLPNAATIRSRTFLETLPIPLPVVFPGIFTATDFGQLIIGGNTTAIPEIVGVVSKVEAIHDSSTEVPSKVKLFAEMDKWFNYSRRRNLLEEVGEFLGLERDEVVERYRQLESVLRHDHDLV
ncbi:MAG: uncharacterized protein KVP18_005257 [Porospora cf. gigantea A]|uniref:uncharacterized protein n=1 Tax=Porospora cf. gigantea A TaxID=2853593 RepID=UPI003559BBC6|nr:MAG: hypothetical protein KVP18_005257 [Porospora cf. gigantea A]